MVKGMFFRPSFCANCGEKIDRADWGVFTSRRFCQVCESEFKGYDLIPRIVVGIGLVIGVFGFGGYLKSGSGASETQLMRQPKKLIDQPMPVAQTASRDTPVTALGNANTAVSAISENQNQAAMRKTETRMQEPSKPLKLQTEIADEVYFCGAKTAKGTPCMHRVKGNVRCFQHVGMPAILPPDKLRIK